VVLLGGFVARTGRDPRRIALSKKSIFLLLRTNLSKPKKRRSFGGKRMPYPHRAWLIKRASACEVGRAKEKNPKKSNGRRPRRNPVAAPKNVDNLIWGKSNVEEVYRERGKEELLRGRESYSIIFGFQWYLEKETVGKTVR